MILPRSCSRVREWTRALFYTRLRPQSEPGVSQEALAGRLRKQSLAAALGGREARPGREQEKGLMPGHPGSSPSIVCTKGLELALATQQVGLGATAPSPHVIDQGSWPP